jgi:hypothetical protein
MINWWSRIRGAVAEYERSLIAERLRRGRLQKSRSILLQATRSHAKVSSGTLIAPLRCLPLAIAQIPAVHATLQALGWSQLRRR